MGDDQKRRSKRQRVAVDYARLDSTGFADCLRVQHKKLARAVLRWPLEQESSDTVAPSVTSLRADQLPQYVHSTGFRNPCVVRATADSPRALGIKLPEGEMTVERLARLVGMDRLINTIDVATQSEGPLYTMAEWVEYFAQPNPRKPLLNVVSLELANTPVQEQMSSPSLVKELDLVNRAWPPSQLPVPKVQLYALMSVAGCFMDFHIDFGGSSVWYHVLSGRKVFLLVPPTKGNLMAFEEWSSSDKQASVFFAERSSGCKKLELSAGDTLLLPGGWPHCVVTPEDSLVIGGNFLTGYNLALQLEIWQMEERLKVRVKFRFPLYKQLMWHTAAAYLEQLRKSHVKQDEEISQLSKWERAGIFALLKALHWWLHQTKDAEVPQQIPDAVGLLQEMQIYLQQFQGERSITGTDPENSRLMQAELMVQDSCVVTEAATSQVHDSALLSRPAAKGDNGNEMFEEDEEEHDPGEDAPDDPDEDFHVSEEESPRSKKKMTAKKQPNATRIAGAVVTSPPVRPTVVKKLTKTNSSVRDRLLKKIGMDPRIPLPRPKYNQKQVERKQ